MTLQKIIEILKAKVVLNFNNDVAPDIQWACSADFMSDVLFFITPDSVLITGLTQPQVIRTAEITGIKTIVFVQDKKPQKETLELARQKKIPLLTTPLSMFTACGRLYAEGLRSCPKK